MSETVATPSSTDLPAGPSDGTDTHGDGTDDHTDADADGTATDGAADHPGPNRAIKALKVVGSNLAAIAVFAIPSVVLWWHVWSTHPSATLTCNCGDTAQQVWFTAWPAYAITHLHSPFFSYLVNVPDGANLLSNTSGTLVSVVLAPITWAWGPIVATNVALTLAPALSAWACYVALRPLVRWRPGAAVAGIVFGYSAAQVQAISYGHVSVSVLIVPPLLFSLLHEILIRQEHSVRRDGLCLAALLVVQFLISPEVVVMCALLAVVGVVPVLLVGWRQIRVRSWHALPALALGIGLAVVVLAYPIWFGIAGPQAVTGVLFALAPLAGVPASGVLSPGDYNQFTSGLLRVGGYVGRVGPPSDYIGYGALYSLIGAVILAWRRPLTWLLVLLGVASLWLSLGSNLIGSLTPWFTHIWLPWRDLSNLPLINEILANQFAPLTPLFVAFLLAVGLDALFVGGVLGSRRSFDPHRTLVTALATAAVGVATLLPLFLTYDMPFTVSKVSLPSYYSAVAPRLPADTVLLTIPFAVTGSAKPMVWQAVDGFHFRLAGAALKTPNAHGGPVQQGLPGSARSILSDLSLPNGVQPSGAVAEVLAVRAALVSWQVDQVVIAGSSTDPVYASGFFTEALGTEPAFDHGAYVWRLRPGWNSVRPAYGATLEACRAEADAPAAAPHPLYMSSCVLSSAGRT